MVQHVRERTRTGYSVCRRFDHNLLLRTPGVGKSRLARRLTTILPAMNLAEALETTRIHSVAGLTGSRTAVVTTRPFRAPSYYLGGGADRRPVPVPGEVSRAQYGIVFPDEWPEFKRHVFDVLRQPLENGVTQIPSPGYP